MERQAYWYSVIQYSPDFIRGEKINVGLILHNAQSGELIYHLIDESNVKIKSVSNDEISNKTYKTLKDFVEYYLEETPKNRTLITPDSYQNDFLSQIANDLPQQFILSEPTFSLTDNPNDLFNALLSRYVGEEYLGTQSNRDVKTVKGYVKEIFQTKNWLGYKVRQNAKIRLKELKGMQFQVDFVFKNGIWNIIHTSPASSDRITDWFSKTRTIIDTYQTDASFYVLYDKNHETNQDNTLVEIIQYLVKKDERVNEIEINSSSFDQLCKKVENEAIDISSYEDEIIA